MNLFRLDLKDVIAAPRSDALTAARRSGQALAARQPA